MHRRCMFACLLAYAYPPSRAQLVYCQGWPYIPYPPKGVCLVFLCRSKGRAAAYCTGERSIAATRYGSARMLNQDRIRLNQASSISALGIYYPSASTCTVSCNKQRKFYMQVSISLHVYMSHWLPMCLGVLRTYMKFTLEHTAVKSFYPNRIHKFMQEGMCHAVFTCKYKCRKRDLTQDG